MAASGAAAGGIAAAPGVGTAGGVAAATADAFAFTSMLGLYAIALAEIHDLPTDDVIRRRTLVLGVMLGANADATLGKIAERTGGHLGRKIVTAVPTDTLLQINRILGRNFVTKYGTKQGILVLGKTVPFGLGAAIGAAGNTLFAQLAIKSAAKLFGPPPDDWPAALRDPQSGPHDPWPPEMPVS